MKRRQNGEGTWGTKVIKGNLYHYYRKRYDGMEKPKEIYGRTVKEVKAKVKEFESNPLNITSHKDLSKLTLGDYLYKWLYSKVECNKPISAKTYDTYENKIESIIINNEKSHIADVQIQTIDKKMVNDFLNLIYDHYSYDTVSKIYSYMRYAFDLAVKDEVLEENPMSSIDRPSKKSIAKEEKEIVFLDTNDMNLIYNEAFRKNVPGALISGKAGTMVYTANAFAVIFLMETGIRVGEFLALKHSDFDLERNLISITKSLSVIKNRDKIQKVVKVTINKKANNVKQVVYVPTVKPPKTKSSVRSMFLTKKAIVAYKMLCKGHRCLSNDFIALTDKGTHMTTKSIGLTLHRMAKRAECKEQECTVHGLRHTFATNLLRLDFQIEDISLLLGHSNTVVTQNVYLHFTKEIKAQKANESLKLYEEKNQNSLGTVSRTVINEIVEQNRQDRERLELERLALEDLKETVIDKH